MSRDRPKSRLRRALLVLSLLYLVVLVASFLIGQRLPHSGMVSDHGASCYWTDAMLVFAECGDEVALSSLLRVFLNLWLLPYYSLLSTAYLVMGSVIPGLLGLLAALVAWAPIAVVGRELFAFFRSRVQRLS